MKEIIALAGLVVSILAFATPEVRCFVGLQSEICPSKSIQAVSNSSTESYIARLSIEDHHNSRGQRLGSAAEIIRQDRANFHKFNKRDREDTYDSVFESLSDREFLEQMVDNSNIPESVKQEIVNGTPVVRVSIHGNYVSVSILE